MDVQVKFIKKFGNNEIGSTLMVHPNMKLHLQKIGVCENDNPIKIELKKEVVPIVLKPSEPVKLTAPVVETPIEVKPKAEPIKEVKPAKVEPIKKVKEVEKPKKVVKTKKRK